MGKYIVELKKNETLYKAATRESDGTAYVCSAIGTPYTEPDLEQVREEAYANGYKEGCDAKFRRLTGSEYQRGLNDAWECARKLVLDTNHGGLTNYEIEEIFGVDEEQTMINYSASECIEKIRQHEQEKEEIKVGDEIENKMTKSKGVVVMDDEDSVQCLSPHGTIFCVGKSRCIRIGHFPEIAEVLAKMKETDNG